MQSLDLLISECRKCDLRGNCEEVKIGQQIGNNAKVMILLDKPHQDESLIGEYFFGRTGKLLKDFVKRANWTDFYITSLVKCLGDYKKRHVEICGEWIKKEIE